MTFNVLPLKRILVRNDGGVWGDDPSGHDDTVVLRSTDQTADGEWTSSDPALRSLSPVERVKARLRAGDLLVTKSSGSALHIGKTTIVTVEIATTNPAYSNFMQRLRVRGDQWPNFYWYCFRSAVVREQLNLVSTTTTGLANLTASTLGDLEVPVPKLDEQRKIADYLDIHTAEIDTLIAKQERLIETLAERRQAVISQAVTKGLDPNVSMKGSGTAWLGDVPTMWAVQRLKNGFDLMKRPVLAADGNVTAFRDGQVTLRSNRRIDGFTEADKEIGYQGIEPKDLVIHAMDAFAGAIGVSDSRGKSTPAYSVCRARAGYDPLYYALTLRHIALSGYIASLGKGVRERSTDFRWNDAKNVLVPVPSLSEQLAITVHLDRETTQIGALAAKAREMIGVLKERRQSLISAAVTGKIDMRGMS